MKRTLFTMIFAGAMIISTLNSCSKKDSLVDQNTGGGGTPSPLTTLSLTTNNWERKANGIFVNTFLNVIPAKNANDQVTVYLLTNGNDTFISLPISFMNGSLWATNTATDIAINYRGNSPGMPLLNIKVVFE